MELSVLLICNLTPAAAIPDFFLFSSPQSLIPSPLRIRFILFDTSDTSFRGCYGDIQHLFCQGEQRTTYSAEQTSLFSRGQIWVTRSREHYLTYIKIYFVKINEVEIVEHSLRKCFIKSRHHIPWPITNTNPEEWKYKLTARSGYSQSSCKINLGSTFADLGGPLQKSI